MKTRTATECTAPRWANKAHTAIDMEVTFAELAHLGALPFTSSQMDTEAHGRDLFKRAKAGEFGTVAPWVDPEEK